MQYHPPLSSASGHTLLLEPRSLVVTTGELYEVWSHSISAEEEDDLGGLELRNEGLLGEEWRERVGRGEKVMREKRVSLTCRVVEKTVKSVLPMRGAR